MTISTTAVDVTYSPDGSTTEFALPFAFADADHVVVELDGVVLNSGYSVEGAGDEDGGTLTFEAAPTAGTSTLYAYRETPLVQEVAPVNNASVFASVLGRGLDLSVLRDQEQAAKIEGKVDLPSGDLAGAYLAFDAEGLPVTASGTGADEALRFDLAEPEGGALVGIQRDALAGAVPQGILSWTNRQAVWPEDLGVTGSTTAAENFTAFQTLFGTPDNGVIYLGPRTYDINDALAWTLSNVRVRGVPNLTRIRTTHRTAMYFLAAIRNVLFEDIIFETISPLESLDYFCVLLSDNQNLLNVRFHRCAFTTTRYDENGDPDVITNVGGVKIIAEDPDVVVEGLHFLDVDITGTGGMGIECQNHPTPDDTVQRFFDVQITGRIRDTGLASVNGQAVSLSGAGSDSRVFIEAENNLYCVIENVGFSASTFGARIRNQTRVCAPLSFTNRVRMDDIVIDDVQCLDESNGDVRLHNLLRPVMRNNRLNVSGGIIFRDVNGLRSVNDRYRTEADVAMSVEATVSGTAKDNEWTALDLETKLASVTALQFFGAGAMYNRVIRPKILPALAGSLAANVSGATQNWIDGRLIADGAPAPQLRTADIPTDADWNMGDGDAPAYFDAPAIQITSTVPLTATRTVTFPVGVPGVRRVRNSTSGGQSITVGQAGGGTTVTIANGATEAIVWTAAGLTK